MTLDKLQEKAQVGPGKLLLEGSNCCDGWSWETMVEELTSTMMRLNPNGFWFVQVSGFGWRKLSGHKIFQAHNGATLLSAILPKTECSFKIHRSGRRGLAVNNSHHDSPTATEWYTILPVTAGTFHDLK